MTTDRISDARLAELAHPTMFAVPLQPGAIGSPMRAEADNAATWQEVCFMALELQDSRARSAEPVAKPSALPPSMESAPKDGTMLRLLVRFDGDSSVGAFEDADTGWTIGSNNCANTGEDEWEIVGWDWEQDTYRKAATATPIGWLPFHHSAALAPMPAVPDGWRELVKEAIDLLTERKHGNPARSPGHNARLMLQEALAAAPPAPQAETAPDIGRFKNDPNPFQSIEDALYAEGDAKAETVPDVVVPPALLDGAWIYACELDDRTSPEDYPNHALLTREELGFAIEEGLRYAGLTVLRQPVQVDEAMRDWSGVKEREAARAGEAAAFAYSKTGGGPIGVFLEGLRAYRVALSVGGKQ